MGLPERTSAFLRLDNEVQESKKAITRNFIRLGMALKTIKDLYEEDEGFLHRQGFRSFNEYLKARDIDKGTGYALIRIIETLALPCENSHKVVEYSTSFVKDTSQKCEDDSIAVVEQLGYFKCKKILPYLQRHPKKREEIIQIALETPSAKLDEVLAPFKPDADLNVPKLASITIKGGDEEISIIRECLEQLVSKGEYGHTPAEVLVTILRQYVDGKDDKSAIRREFIEYFCQQHQQVLQTKYRFEGGKDGRIVNELISTYDLDELKELVREFFATPENDRWWTRFTLGTFLKAIPDLIAHRKEGKNYAKYLKLEQEWEQEWGWDENDDTETDQS